ncbi:MAG: D-alanine--poly(phosphoribitol) ligase subunit DltA [Verrucomicrobiaceae bacterium]|nr:D-alanine--poly(phosphoribitol) ligase subunit DltA [Verrucomicrobiaceae bacterium]
MRGLIEQIRDAAERHASRIAHASGDREITYGELWQRAEALAGWLHGHAGPRDGPVIIRGRKEPEMLIGFLGAALSGRAYVPVDAALPEARLASIISAAKPALTIDVADVAAFSHGSHHHRSRMEAGSPGDAPFYILFTSGSTGEPKGVVITHACLASFVRWQHAEHRFEHGAEIILNQAPFTFDLSVMDIYTSLTCGGTIVSLGGDELANPRTMFGRLRTSGITTWVSTPSFAGMCLVEKGFDETMIPSVRRFWFCGETLPHRTAAALLQRFPRAEVWNTYGPTEATVATTSVRIDAGILDAHDPLPIGRAMPGTRVEVRAADGRRCTEGESGELVIIGPNVSPGYLGASHLNPGSFFVEDGLRGYHTGDRGRETGGYLFFDGRMDSQVKVRGFRIELGDVESHLRGVNGVVDAVVLPVQRRGVNESLAAFVILSRRDHGDDFVQAQAIRGALAERLPDYMLPRRLEFVPSFPLTANGKADRRALAARLHP